MVPITRYAGAAAAIGLAVVLATDGGGPWSPRPRARLRRMQAPPQYQDGRFAHEPPEQKRKKQLSSYSGIRVVMRCAR